MDLRLLRGRGAQQVRLLPELRGLWVYAGQPQVQRGGPGLGWELFVCYIFFKCFVVYEVLIYPFCPLIVRDLTSNQSTYGRVTPSGC